MQLARKSWAAAGVSHKVSRPMHFFSAISPLHAPSIHFLSGITLYAQAKTAPLLCSNLVSGMQIDERMGPAMVTLQGLLDKGGADSFDFAFIGMLIELKTLLLAAIFTCLLCTLPKASPALEILLNRLHSSHTGQRAEGILWHEVSRHAMQTQTSGPTRPTLSCCCAWCTQEVL
jgi:hypothetical protein